jgi:hypothetical protein
MTDDENPTTIWVTSDVTPFGNYQLAIHFDDDTSRVLDRDAAYAYASTVIDASERAEYYAAVIRQFSTTLKAPKELAASVAGDLRADLPPLDVAAVAPLDLRPGVSHRDGSAFLAIWRNGKQVGQWSPADARGHALHVLQALHVVPLDAAYRRYLIGPINIEPDRAANIVDDLQKHRQDQP